MFLHRDHPVLFINCKTVEKKYGSSYTNDEEATVVKNLVQFLSTQMGYDKTKFGFVSPYQGQV
jgi:hypothetical protein